MCAALLAVLVLESPARGEYPETVEEWIGPLGPDNAWAYTVAVDPHLAGVVYTSTGSIYKTTDGGASWQAKNHGVRTSRKIVEIVIDPNDSATLYAVSTWDGEIYKSTDGGESWTSKEVLAVRGTFELAVDPADSSTLYLVQWDGAVHKSADGGERWSRLSAFPEPPAGGLVIDPGSPGTLWVGIYAGVAKSTDGGATWTGYPVGVSADVPVADLALDGAGTLYAAVRSGSGTLEGGCYKSVDGGLTWSQVLQHRRLGIVRGDPTAPGTVYAAGGGAVHKSTDAGATWTTHVPGFNARGIADLAVDPLSPSSVYVAAMSCCDASPAVVKSTDGGLSWAPANGGIKTLASVAVDPLDPDRLYAANGWGGAYRSADGGLSWQRIDRDAAGERVYLYWASIEPAPTPDETHLYALTNGGFLKSDDRGESWRLSSAGLPAGWVGPLRTHPETPSTLYLGTDEGLYQSLDGGESWAALAAELADVRALAVDPSSPATLVVGAYGTGLFRSTDGGATWTLISDYPWWRGALEIDPSSNIYAATLTGLNTSTDGGATWSGQPVWTNGLLIDPLDPRILYVASVGDGVLRSVDAGTTWTAIRGLPDTQVILGSSMAFDPELPSTLYVVFRGVYRLTFAPRVAALSPDHGVPGDRIVLAGRNFRPGRGDGTVTFNGISAEIESWSDGEIVALVPPGRTTGPVEVTVLGVGSDPDPWFTLDYVEVAIDLKPASYPNCLRIDGHGVIPVAVLGAAELDVSQIDVGSLSFAGLEVRVRGNGAPQCSYDDVGGDPAATEGAPDGLLDLVCHFVDDPSAWSPGSSTATLAGALVDGTPIQGEDEICVVP